ncbi:YcxB family protein [Nonomuraea sp. bgisy101]|uniref:YcxB family protein n=1 Tax=Nonomuraea sp. bgisy101 TaxID=3413784 RepID=UPI003D75B879
MAGDDNRTNDRLTGTSGRNPAAPTGAILRVAAQPRMMVPNTSDKGGMVDFTLSYQPTPDEVSRALYQGVRRQLKRVYLALPAVLAASGLVCIVVGGVSIGIGMLAGAVVFPFVLSLSIRRIAKRQLTYLCVPTTLQVTDDGYETRTDQSTVTARWSLFGRIESTPEFWLLFVNNQCTGFLPRRAFTGEQQAELDELFAKKTRIGS